MSEKKVPVRLGSHGVASLASGLAILSACGVAELPSSQSKNVVPMQRALLGQDADLTVAAGKTVSVNTYAPLIKDAAAGDAKLYVNNANALKLAKGDLVLIIQMQGAEIKTTNDINFGAVSNINGAGLYEMIGVTAVDTVNNIITLDTACGGTGIKNGYRSAAHTQVVRVPQYNNVTVAATGKVIPAQAWDGSIGGIVALTVQNDAKIDGSIDASGSGFRGGTVHQGSGLFDITDYVSTVADNGAEKGEGVAGGLLEYTNLKVQYARGPAANGGGGGNAHNAGGGGGANGLAVDNAGNAKPWTGQGVMDQAVTGANAWKLDPGYIAAGNAFTDSSGGGRGGYTYGANKNDPVTVGPGQTAWAGDNRRERGGLGGRPLTQKPAQRLFFGGGGGAGDSNNSTGGSGGRGGGLLFLTAGTISGAGSLLADGAPGVATTGAGNDAPGGGGGGGTVVAIGNKSFAGVSVSARGGAGGVQTITGNESEGPGGGGGGGVVVARGGNITASAAAGKAGTSNSGGLSATFLVNGATDGNAGEMNVGAQIPTTLQFPACVPIDIAVVESHQGTSVQLGGTAAFTVNVTNNGPNPAVGAQLVTTLSPGLTVGTWTCTASGGATCPAASGTGPLPTKIDMPVGGSLSFQVNVPVPNTYTGSSVVLSTTVAPPIPVTDTAPNNNTNVTDSVPVATRDADLSITVAQSPSGATPGNPTTYTFGVQNAGPGQVDPQVTITIPAGAQVGQAPSGSGWTCTPSGSTQYVCSRTALGVGTAPDITAVFTMPTDQSTPTVTGQVTAPGVSDPNLANNSASAQQQNTNVMPTANDLSVAISKNPDPGAPGQDVTYTIAVTNNGTTAVSSPVVTFTIPPGSAVISGPTGSGWTCTNVTTTYTCTAATAAPGAAPPIQITCNTPGQSGTAGAVVAVVDSPNNVDPQPANNVATASVGQQQQTGSDLSVALTQSPDAPGPGTEVTYTLTATNNGPDSVGNVVVSLTVPPGSTVTMPAAGDGWTCAQSGNTYFCSRPSLAQGSAPPVVLKVVTPTQGAATPSTVATVQAAGNNDPNPANNTAQVGSLSGRLAGGGWLSCNTLPQSRSGSGAVLWAVGAGLALVLGLRRRRLSA